MITCEKCGTQMLDNLTTCPGCGAPVAEQSGAEESVTTTNSPSAVDSPDAVTAADARAQSAAAPAKAASGGMSAMTKAAIAAAVAIAVAGLLIFWQLRTGHARGLNLTPDDMSLLAESAPPQQRMMLSSDPEARKEMAKNLREILAIAEEARAKGFADRPEVKNTLETMRHFVLAQVYAAKQREGGNPASGAPFTPEELDAFLKEPGRDAQFEQFLKDAQKAGLLPPDEIKEPQKQQLKQRWGPAMLLSRKATEAGLDKERKTQLQIELQKANILAQAYAEELVKGLEPTDADVDAAIAGARREAEDLQKRARGGEDFEALARQNSDEPGADQRGGDLGWFGRGQMVKEFEDAAFGMQEGQVSDVIETQFGFHVIKVEGRRNEKGEEGKPEEQVKARHILVRPEGISQPGRMSGPKPLREQVRESLARDRQEAKIKEIVDRSKVQVPEEFVVKAPEMPKPPTSPHGELPPAPPAEGGGQQGGTPPRENK